MGDALRELGQLYDTYAPRIFRYIFHRLGDQCLAEDLTSEVFIRFLRNRPTHDHVAPFLYRVAHNLIVDHLRQRPLAQALDDQVAGDQGDPTRLAEYELERGQLRRAISQLTPTQQQVIVLKFLEGLTNEEILACLEQARQRRQIAAASRIDHTA